MAQPHARSVAKRVAGVALMRVPNIGAFPAAAVNPIGMPAFQPPPAEPAATTFDADPLDRIAKLAKLRDSGALTEEESSARRPSCCLRCSQALVGRSAAQSPPGR